MTLDECTPGMAITWLHTPRGGYGYVVPVPGRVVSVGKKLVRISIWRQSDNSEVERNVDAGSLKPAGEQAPNNDPVMYATAIRHLMDIARRTLTRFTFNPSNEAALQFAVQKVLHEEISGTGLLPSREIRTAGGRYDIAVIDTFNDFRAIGTLVRPAQIVLELKLKASPSAVERQAQRYAKQPDVDAVMVVSTSQVLLSKLVPGTIGGKPFELVALRTF